LRQISYLVGTQPRPGINSRLPESVLQPLTVRRTPATTIRKRILVMADNLAGFLLFLKRTGHENFTRCATRPPLGTQTAVLNDVLATTAPLG
jgi:hypothetical protein